MDYENISSWRRSENREEKHIQLIRYAAPDDVSIKSELEALHKDRRRYIPNLEPCSSTTNLSSLQRDKSKQSLIYLSCPHRPLVAETVSMKYNSIFRIIFHRPVSPSPGRGRPPSEHIHRQYQQQKQRQHSRLQHKYI